MFFFMHTLILYRLSLYRFSLSMLCSQLHAYWPRSISASEMTYIMSSGALNSTHSLTHSPRSIQFQFRINNTGLGNTKILQTMSSRSTTREFCTIQNAGEFPHQRSYLPHRPFGTADAPPEVSPFQLWVDNIQRC